MPKKEYKKNTICIYCKKKVYKEDKKYMVGLEKPYINLFLHMDCYKKIKDNLLEFLENNLEDYINNFIF